MRGAVIFSISGLDTAILASANAGQTRSLYGVQGQFLWKDPSVRDLLFYARRISKARLLSPEESRRESLDMRQRPDLNGYLLHLGLSNALVTKIEEDKLRGIRFPIYPLRCGVMLAVPTVQAGDLQVRVAVPLIDQKSVDWARDCVLSQRIRWLFEITETRQTALLQVERAFPNAQDAIALIAKSRREMSSEALTKDMTSMLTVLVHDEAIDSCVKGVVVKDVRVGLVDDFSTTENLAGGMKLRPLPVPKGLLH